MALSTRIVRLRKSHSLSQKELAITLNISASALCQYEKGSRIPSDEVKAQIADFFHVSIDYLLGRPSNDSISDSLLIPVLGSIPAGIPLEAIEEIVDWEEIPRAMSAGGKEFFALKVSGDSMYPEYLDGDTVILLSQQCCESGDVCAVYVNGYDATLKTVKFGEDGSLSTIPKNPAYPPRTYTPQEIEELPVSIAGVVVELRRQVRKSYLNWK